MAMKILASGINFTAITVSDTNLVNCKAIFVGVGGDIAIAPSVGATAVLFKNVANGTILPIELKNGTINTTNTTATNLINLNW